MFRLPSLRLTLAGVLATGVVVVGVVATVTGVVVTVVWTGKDTTRAFVRAVVKPIANTTKATTPRTVATAIRVFVEFVFLNIFAPLVCHLTNGAAFPIRLSNRDRRTPSLLI